MKDVTDVKPLRYINLVCRKRQGKEMRWNH